MTIYEIDRFLRRVSATPDPPLDCPCCWTSSIWNNKVKTFVFHFIGLKQGEMTVCYTHNILFFELATELHTAMREGEIFRRRTSSISCTGHTLAFRSEYGNE